MNPANNNADGDLSTGNLDDVNTDTDSTSGGLVGSANPSLSVLIDSGADEDAVFGLVDPTDPNVDLQVLLPALSSGGEPLIYAVSGNVLTASTNAGTIFTLTVNADGSWTFDLDGQLDHVADSGDDADVLALIGGGSVDAIDFTAVVTVTDADGDTATLSDIYNNEADIFTVAVENDVPEVTLERTDAFIVVDETFGPRPGDANAEDEEDGTGTVIADPFGNGLTPIGLSRTVISTPATTTGTIILASALSIGADSAGASPSDALSFNLSLGANAGKHGAPGPGQRRCHRRCAGSTTQRRCPGPGQRSGRVPDQRQ